MHPGFQPVPLRRAQSRPPLTSLLTPAIVVAAIVAANIAVGILFLINTRHLQVLVNKIVAGDYVTESSFVDTAHRQHELIVSAQVATAALLAALMVWTAVALRNVGRLEPGAEGSPWALLTWFVPPLLLFSPPRMWTRIRNAQRMALPPRQRPRGNFEVIAAWWLLVLCVLGIVVFTWVDGEVASRLPSLSVQIDHIRRMLRLRLVFGGLLIAAAVAALACVAMITRTNEKFRALPALLDVELPGPPATPIPLRPHVASSYPSSIFPVAVHPSDPRWKPEPPTHPAPDGERGYWS